MGKHSLWVPVRLRLFPPCIRYLFFILYSLFFKLTELVILRKRIKNE